MFSLETEKLRQVQERQFEAMSNRLIYLSVANIFWVQKESHEIPDGYVIYDQTPEELAELFKLCFADSKNIFTFPSKKLILGKSKESIIVPSTETWYLQEKAVNTSSITLPLNVHLAAPLIKTGFQGNIVFEFFNTSDENLKIDVTDVYAKAFVLEHSKSQTYEGQYQGQSIESVPFPDLKKEHEELKKLRIKLNT